MTGQVSTSAFGPQAGSGYPLLAGSCQLDRRTADPPGGSVESVRPAGGFFTGTVRALVSRDGTGRV